MARVVIVLFLACLSLHIQAFSYDDRLRKEVKRCEAIDSGEFSTGLWLNPEGKRSFYHRSACFQRAAIRFRQSALCENVRRRWSLFGSSWGYSRSHCEEEVARGVAEDREKLLAQRDAYNSSPVRLKSFVIEKNGNGRDFDIIPRFSAGTAHGYQLDFYFTENRKLLAGQGFHLDGNNNIRMYVPVATIRQRFPAFEVGRSYLIEARLVWQTGYGGQSGYWSPEFINETWPEHQRTQVTSQQVTFNSLAGY